MKSLIPDNSLITIALGGNALAQAKQKHTIENMMNNAKKTSEQITKLIEHGHKIAIAHGNGPQVGAIILQNQCAEKHLNIPSMPMYVCGAKSQGLIGFSIQQTLQNELKKSKDSNVQKKNVVSLITQVEVDPKDPAFENPTKPVGSFYTKEEADKIAKNEGKKFVHDKARGGYRVVVPSPIPKDIVEIESIKNLVNSGHIVIASGGGGIPVTKDENGLLKGVDSVIDKDRATSLLAEELKADAFVILTDVDSVFINFDDKDKRKALKKCTVTEAKKYIANGEFGKGSMLPKVESAIRFVEKTGKIAIITSLNYVLESIEGTVGTYFVNE